MVAGCSAWRKHGFRFRFQSVGGPSKDHRRGLAGSRGRGNNLTVQISALRRVLDQDGPEKKSCIQTVPGRGYRFVASVTRLNEDAHAAIPGADTPGEQSGRSRVLPDLSIATVPRLSFVVLPFTNLGETGDEDYLADAITMI
jgi:hypothetical protein